MKKYQTATTILLPRNNKAKCPVYQHEGKFYIKANKPNTSSYQPFFYDGEEYSEVIQTGNGFWHKA